MIKYIKSLKKKSLLNEEGEEEKLMVDIRGWVRNKRLKKMPASGIQSLRVRC